MNTSHMPRESRKFTSLVKHGWCRKHWLGDYYQDGSLTIA